MKLQQTKISPFTVFFDNSEEFHILKSEVFSQGVYYFETSNPRPRIIDVGAHIGLSILYFKKLYPGARITAIEPNPHSFEILEKNIFENQLEDVDLHQVALADHAGELEFFLDASPERWFSTSSFTPGAWNETQESDAITVTTQPLADFLQLAGSTSQFNSFETLEPIDLLKMDIEGAEQEVLFSAGEYLSLVKHCIIEFHPRPNQSLEKIVEFLKDRGFKVTVWKKGKEAVAKYVRGLVYIDAVRK